MPTLQEIIDILLSCPYKDKQITFTLGYKKFRVAEMNYQHGSAEPIEIKLEEVKE